MEVLVELSLWGHAEKKKCFDYFIKIYIVWKLFSLNVVNGGNTKLINLEELYIEPVLLMDSQYHFL